jgi:hypothetical protein
MLANGVLAGFAKIVLVSALTAGGGASVYLMASTSALDPTHLAGGCTQPAAVVPNSTETPMPTSTPKYFRITSTPPIVFRVRSGAEFSVWMGASGLGSLDVQSDLVFDAASVQIVSVVMWHYQRNDPVIIGLGSETLFKDISDQLAQANRAGMLSNVSGVDS